MSAIAQRRTAAAAAIIMLLAVLQYVLFAVNPAPANAAGPEPTYGTAVVDGDIGEWDLGADYFADLIKAGGNGGQTEVLGKAYLRYDCETSNLYVLALSEGDFDGLGEAWVKIYEIGNDEANTTEAQVGDIGFETVVPNVPEGDYSIEIHFNDNGDTASNARGGGSLTIACPEPQPGAASVSLTGRCDEDKQIYEVYVTSTNAVTYVDRNDNGAFEGSEAIVTGFLDIELPGGTVVEWQSIADDGFQFDGGETTISGSFVVDDCTPPPPPPPGEVRVSVSGECAYDEVASYTYTVTASEGVTVDFDGGDQNLTNGDTYTSGSGSASWVATAPDGSVFAGTESGTVSGTENVDDCTPPPPPPPPPPPTTPTTTPEVKGAIGDLVWFDENRNGQQDDATKEFPINGATVTLLAPNGTVLAQQVTGLDGLYLFDQLDAGNYRVEVCVAGAEYTTTNAPGVAKGLNSDVFPLADKAACARTGLINLPEGVTDLTWDAGLVIEVRGIQVEPTTTTAPTTTTIEPVTVGTLPFTGFETEDLAILGIGALAAGSALLLLMRRREDESDGEVVSGWSNT